MRNTQKNPQNIILELFFFPIQVSSGDWEPHPFFTISTTPYIQIYQNTDDIKYFRANFTFPERRVVRHSIEVCKNVFVEKKITKLFLAFIMSKKHWTNLANVTFSITSTKSISVSQFRLSPCEMHHIFFWNQQHQSRKFHLWLSSRDSKHLYFQCQFYPKNSTFNSSHMKNTNVSFDASNYVHVSPTFDSLYVN